MQTWRHYECSVHIVRLNNYGNYYHQNYQCKIFILVYNKMLSNIFHYNWFYSKKFFPRALFKNSHTCNASNPDAPRNVVYERPVCLALRWRSRVYRLKDTIRERNLRSNINPNASGWFFGACKYNIFRNIKQLSLKISPGRFRVLIIHYLALHIFDYFVCSNLCSSFVLYVQEVLASFIYQLII